MKPFLLISIFITLQVISFAQSKKPLSHDVYDGWQTATNRNISNDGKWVLYSATPQEGDASLYIHDIQNAKSTPKIFARGEQAQFSEDSRFVIFRIKPHLDTLKNQRRRKIKESKLPKDSLGIYDLKKDTLIKIPNVKSFQTSPKTGNFIAFLLEEIEEKKEKKIETEKDSSQKVEKEKTKIKPKKDNDKKEKDKKKEKNKKENTKINLKKDSLNVDSLNIEKNITGKYTNNLNENDKLKNEIKSLQAKLKKYEEKEEKNKNKDRNAKKTPKKENKENGSKLVLHNLLTAKQDTFLFVTNYTLHKKGKKLAFASTGDDSTFKAGVYIFDLQKNKLTQVLNKAGKFKNLTFDEEATQLSFIADTDTTKKSEKLQFKFHSLYHWAEKQKEATILAEKLTKDIPLGYMVADDNNLSFSKDGNRLFFSIEPIPLEKDTTLLPEEIVNVDIWHWQNDKLPTEQTVELKDDNKNNSFAVVYPKSKKIIAFEDMESVRIAPEGQSDFALGINSKPYKKNSSWEGYPQKIDVYALNLKDGKRKKIKTGIKANISISTFGNYIIWYYPQDSTWNTYNFKTEKIQILNKNFKKFYNELHDTPDLPNSYGLAGWFENDESVVVYDKYDLWQLDVEGKNNPTRLTLNGNEQKITFRNVFLDEEQRFFKKGQISLLLALDNDSKAEGYFSYTTGNKENPRKLLLDNYKFSAPLKAKNAERYIFTRESFTDCPDVYFSDNQFTKINKLSNLNPQQSKYFWGSVEMVKWISTTGEELQGLLYKPEGFDEGKKYPMIVYYYERHSEDLHEYIAPAPSASTIRAPMFTSNGYLVFMPDIPYKTAEPGESAYNAIMSGVAYLLNKGFVDKDKMGLQGQSWGGYQTAYMITRTDLFACAMAGAPVANMTSAYGGIRYGTGISRIFQYEKGQSRIGATLWEKPNAYLQNSPLFHLDKVKTPLLIMHNDKDGAVPFTQGIELFMGLKRLQKPVWLLNYNDEDHNLVQRKNRKDLSIRMHQFFDYYLKFQKPPRWLKDGLPIIEKGIKKGYETTD
jgi:dipeptidyl aminopeptidase/acylaminoacyl peptidase